MPVESPKLDRQTAQAASVTLTPDQQEVETVSADVIDAGEGSTSPEPSSAKPPIQTGRGVLERLRPLSPRDFSLGRSLIAPLAGILGFLLLWALLAPLVETSLGELPGPRQVAVAGGDLFEEWQAARADEASFYEQQDVRNAALIAEGRGAEVQDFEYSGPPTFLDQIWTSLRTVGLGFLIGVIIAVPVGLVAGLSKTFKAAINPLVQIFKPVSPLAWLPIVTMIIAATMTSPDPILPKSFIISALVVTLNSLWPTLINTWVGAESVDEDLINVSRVLRLPWFTKLRKVVLPSALPYIFTGMRLSLGVGWMVLIAAEMLAQNPGLGKFVWDEFQNGSSQSLARIMFAVIVIGLIGFMLDKLMGLAETLVSRNRVA